MGRQLLLRVLRGEEINLAEIEAQYMPRKVCGGCGFAFFKEKFSGMQWVRKELASFCKRCCDIKKEQGTPHQCTICAMWKPDEDFDAREKCWNRTNTRSCTSCVIRRPCAGECQEFKPESYFTPGEWMHAARNNS